MLTPSLFQPVKITIPKTTLSQTQSISVSSRFTSVDSPKTKPIFERIYHVRNISCKMGSHSNVQLISTWFELVSVWNERTKVLVIAWNRTVHFIMSPSVQACSYFECQAFESSKAPFGAVFVDFYRSTLFQPKFLTSKLGVRIICGYLRLLKSSLWLRLSFTACWRCFYVDLFQ